jgi:hypothetical protein
MVGASETMRAGFAVMVISPLAAASVTGNPDEASDNVVDGEPLAAGVPAGVLLPAADGADVADVEDAEQAARPVTTMAASAAQVSLARDLAGAAGGFMRATSSRDVGKEGETAGPP